MLSPRAILKHSSKISAANFIGLAVSIPTSLIVTRVLGPELYGIVGIILLWPYYADLFRLGLMPAVMREVPALREAGNDAAADRIQNVAVSGELAYGLAACVVLLASSFVVDDPMIARGVRVSAVVFATTHVYQILLAMQWANREFRSVSRLSLYHRLVSSLGILALLWLIGPYSLVVAPGLAAIVAIVLIFAFAPPRSLRLTWSNSELKRLMSVGIALMLFSFFMQGFKVVDRTAIATWMSPTDLGLFAFALNFVNITTVAFSDFGGVMQPMIWGKLGENGRMADVSDSVQKTAILLVAVSCACATLGQAVFGAFVHLLVPRFELSVPVFDWLVLLLPIYVSTMFPSMLLVSRLLNKQSTNAAIWGIGVALKGLIFIVLIRALHLGLPALALGAVAAQLLIAIALYAAVHGEMFPAGGRTSRRFYGWLLGIAAVGTIGGLLLRQGFLAFDAIRMWQTLSLRVVAAIALWGAAAILIYREWMRGSGRPAPIPMPAEAFATPIAGVEETTGGQA